MIFNGGLPPTHILIHWPHTRCLYGLLSWGALPTLLPNAPSRITRYPPSYFMVNPSQHIHHYIPNDPTLTPYNSKISTTTLYIISQDFTVALAFASTLDIMPNLLCALLRLWYGSSYSLLMYVMLRTKYGNLDAYNMPRLRPTTCPSPSWMKNPSYTVREIISNGGPHC